MPDVPKSAKKPQDRAPKKSTTEAAAAEATTEPIEIDFRGQHYTINPKVFTGRKFAQAAARLQGFERANDDFNAMMAIDELVQYALGGEQWTAFLAANHDPDIDDIDMETLAEFFDEINESVGNQPASSHS